MSFFQSRTRRWLFAIALFAFALRLGFVLKAGERVLVDDETGYDNIASNVVSGLGYEVGQAGGWHHPTAARGPSYIFYLAGFYKVFGHRVLPPLVGQCVLDVLALLFAYWIALRLFASKRGALFTAALYAVYPIFIFNTTQLITETFTNFVFLAAIAAFLKYVADRRARYLVLCGIAAGLGALVKPPMAPLAAILALTCVTMLGWRTAFRAGAIATLVAGLVMAPWVIRNSLVFHEFIPGVTLVGYTFWGGTAPAGGIRTIGSISDPAVPDSVRTALKQVNGELEQSHWFMNEGLRVIKNDPWRYARLSFRKIFQLWLNVGFDEPPSRVSYALAATGLASFAFAIYALRAAHPIPIAAPMLIGLWFFWTLANLPAPVLIRYAMPYYGLLFCFTGPGADAALSKLAGANHGLPNERTDERDTATIR